MCDSTKSCCCGCTLKVGTSLLLWSTIITWVIVLIIYLSTAIGPTEHISAVYSSNEYQIRHTVSLQDHLEYQWWQIILILFPLVISVLGIYGVSKGKSGFIMPYLLYRILWAIAATVTLLIPICILLFGASKTNDAKNIISQFALFQQVDAVGNTIIFVLVLVAALFICVIAMEIHFARVIAAYLKSLEIMPINYYSDAEMKNGVIVPLCPSEETPTDNYPMPYWNNVHTNSINA